MKIRDIIGCGLLDLSTQKKRNRIAFILLYMSIIIYVGVNSTINGILNGIERKIYGHDARILWMKGQDDKAEEEYNLLVDMFGDDERVQEIYVGSDCYGAMRWYDTMEYLGVDMQHILMGSAYESLFNYDYKGEKRLPEYDEVILPRYMYELGIYDEYTYFNSDELIGKTLTIRNQLFYPDGNEYKVKVIGTFDNATKFYRGDVFMVNVDFMRDMMWINAEDTVKYNQEMGYDLTMEQCTPRFTAYMFIKEGYDIVEVQEEFDNKVKERLGTEKQQINLFTRIDPIVKGYYLYAIAVANIVSSVLLVLAVINIMISSATEVKNRKWEFALRMSMGYRKRDVVAIFAIEKIANVLKAVTLAVITIFLYSKALTYYHQNMTVYWKRGWIIAVDVKSTLISIWFVVMAALVGVIVAYFSMKKIKVAKTLKAGE